MHTTIIILLAIIAMALVFPRVLRGTLLLGADVVDILLLPVTVPRYLIKVTMGGLLAPLYKHRVLGLIVVVSLGYLGLLLVSHL